MFNNIIASCGRKLKKEEKKIQIQACSAEARITADNAGQRIRIRASRTAAELSLWPRFDCRSNVLRKLKRCYMISFNNEDEMAVVNEGYAVKRQKQTITTTSSSLSRLLSQLNVVDELINKMEDYELILQEIKLLLTRIDAFKLTNEVINPTSEYYKTWRDLLDSKGTTIWNKSTELRFTLSEDTTGPTTHSLSTINILVANRTYYLLSTII
jgi:hypothetical protein